MKALADHVAHYLSAEVTRILERPGAREVRPIFRGLPCRLMDELLARLGGPSGLRIATSDGVEEHVPVFLVGNVATNPEGLASGRCTDSHLLRVRNNPACRCFLTLLPPGSVVNESISSSATYLGVEPVVEAGELAFDPFTSQLVRRAIAGLQWSQKQRDAAEHVVDQALTDAARLDIGSEERERQWEVIERLFEVCSSQAPSPRLLLAALGLPPCNLDDLGTAQHVGVLARVGQELESQGFAAAFDSWIAAADDLREALVAAQSFLRGSSGDGSTFAKAPSSYYRVPISDVLKGNLPNWWDALTLARWDELLHSDVAPDRALRVTANGIVDSGAGLPVLFQDVAAFTITVADDEPDGAIVKISVSKGTKDFTELAEVTLTGRSATFSHDESPDHHSPLRYRFEADGYTAVTVPKIVERYPGWDAIASVVASEMDVISSKHKEGDIG